MIQLKTHDPVQTHVPVQTRIRKTEKQDPGDNSAYVDELPLSAQHNERGTRSWRSHQPTTTINKIQKYPPYLYTSLV